MANRCRICGSTDAGPVESFDEQMFRIGESFSYFGCNECGCFQISELPPQMAKYYPDDYYSYDDTAGDLIGRLRRGLRTFLAYRGPRQLFEGQAWWERGDIRALHHTRAELGDSILDLGCGSGVLLSQLKDIGFRNLMGADPYISEDLLTPNGVLVRKIDASGIDREFDVVMMHHSLEHVWDQHALVRGISNILRPGGKCIIRIPTIESWAWENYHGDWIQLDPPRHFYLHSRRSVTRLLEEAFLEVTEIIDDSNSYQILGSEKIRTGAPLIDPITKTPNFAAHLSSDTIAGAQSRAKALNLQGRGDSIAVHARKPAR